LIKHKHRYVVVIKNTCSDGANTVAIMFSFIYCCDEFHLDRLITCMPEWEAAKGYLGRKRPEGEATKGNS